MLPSKEEKEYWDKKNANDMKIFMFQKAVEFTVNIATDRKIPISKDEVIKNFNLLRDSCNDVFSLPKTEVKK